MAFANDLTLATQECLPWTNFRNTDSWVPSQAHWIRICILNNIPWCFKCTLDWRNTDVTISGTQWGTFPSNGIVGLFTPEFSNVLLWRNLESPRKMILHHGGCIFKQVFLETIEIDNMSSETLWLHSVLMRAEFYSWVPCLENDFLTVSQTFLPREQSLRKRAVLYMQGL